MFDRGMLTTAFVLAVVLAGLFLFRWLLVVLLNA